MEQDINLTEKQLISQAFEAFNKTINKLRKYQRKLEKQISQLTEELSIKNQEMSNVLESLDSGLIVTDLDGMVIRFNRTAANLLETDPETAIGTHVNQLTSCKFIPEDSDLRNLSEDLRSFPQEQNFYDSKKKKFILASEISPMYSEDDKEYLGIIVNINDITLLKSLQEESDRKNRMVAMGQIAANVAHEIRNPLGSIELFVSMLKMDFQEDEEKSTILNHIHSGVRSMNHIISNILQYSRPRPISLSELNLEELADEFVNFSEHMAKHHSVEVKFLNEVKNARIRGDRELLKQVFQNVFMNALQSMPEGGKLEIILSEEISRSQKKIELFKKDFPEKRNRLRIIKVCFKDSGKGMPENLIRQIFDPFFTTKEKGTGLGLYIIRNIIESHRGFIGVTSEEDVGTEITIEFVASDQDSE